MEKYLALIILAAPGFIAAKIAAILGITSSKRGEIDSLASYLSYSFFSVLIAILISSQIGIVDLSENWQDFTDKFSSVGFTVNLLLTTLLSAVIIGLSWALVGNKLFLQVLNFINVKSGRNKRRMNGSLLNRIFDDGKEHFIIVRKDSEKIAVGFIYSATDPSAGKTELVITEYPEYRAELKKVENNPDYQSYLRNVLQTYIDVENNIVITETEYPPEWSTND